MTASHRQRPITLEWLREIGGPRSHLLVRIWSRDRSAWWRPDGAGYTTVLEAAGVYTLCDAYSRTCHCGPEKKIVFQPIPHWRRDARNPVLALPSIARLRALSPDAKGALEAILADLTADANARAKKSWRAKKAPMAAYWKAVGVYAKHVRRALLSDEVADV